MLYVLLNDRLKAGALGSVFLVQKLVEQKVAIGDGQSVPEIFSSPNIMANLSEIVDSVIRLKSNL